MAGSTGQKRGPAAAASLLLIWLCLQSATVPGQTGISVITEPGIPLKDGIWMIPIGLVDDQGAPLEVPVDGVKPVVAGQTVSDHRVGVFAPRQGGMASSVAVLVDGDFPATGADLLGGFLASVSRDGRKGLFLCGTEMQAVQEFGRPALAADRYEELLGRDEPGRLWDSVLAALAELGGEEQARRVLFIVSAGGEDLASEHPLAACVEGALRTRVAVHVLELPGNPAGAARLRELARKSGGRSTPFNGLASLRRALAIVDNIRPLVVPAGGRDLPGELTVGFAFSDQVTGTATVAEPKPLEGPAIWVLAGLVLGILAVAGGGFVLFRSVTRKSGFLVVNHQGRQREVPIPRSGVTIGSDPDNVLILEDARIARHHAVVRERSGQVIVTDLRSTHGTAVNGHQVRNAQLRDGDHLLLGKVVEMTFRKNVRAKN